MIRVIVVETDAHMAAHVGGPVHVSYKTFEIEAPELEKFLAECPRSLCERSIVGVESPAEQSALNREGGK